MTTATTLQERGREFETNSEPAVRGTGGTHTSRELRWMGAVVLLVLVYLAVPLLFGGDPNFGSFARGLEREYKLRRTSIPFLWLAEAVVHVAHPYGVKRLDIALFEDQDCSALMAAPGLQSRVHSFLGPSWRPFVEVHSPKKGERVLLYARERGQDMEMFVFTVESNEACGRAHPRES